MLTPQYAAPQPTAALAPQSLGSPLTTTHSYSAANTTHPFHGGTTFYTTESPTNIVASQTLVPTTTGSIIALCVFLYLCLFIIS